MKKISLLLRLGIVLGCGFILTGCEGKSENAATSNSSSTSAATVKPTKIEQSSGSSSKKKTISSPEEAAAEKIELRRPVEWSEDWQGLKTSINEVGLGTFNKDDQISTLFDGTGLVSVHFVIENTSDHDFMTYPNQATAVVNGQQVTSELLLGGSVSGDILSNVKKEGSIYFDIPEMKDIKEVSEIRLKWDANNPASDDYQNNRKEYDITISLK